ARVLRPESPTDQPAGAPASAGAGLAAARPSESASRPARPSRDSSLGRAQAGSLLRHALSVIGGILIGRGVLSAEEAVALGGVILPAASIAWSLWERWNAHRDADLARNLSREGREGGEGGDNSPAEPLRPSRPARDPIPTPEEKP
ncbi:MAG: hypothetical protein ACKVYV_11905, partial [Limisphaerales bacterium]